MIVFAFVCFVAVVVGFAVLLLVAAMAPTEPTNQRTTYHEFRYSSHRPRCRRRTRIDY